MTEEIKKAQEEIKKLIHDIQEEHKSLGTDTKSTSEKLEKLSADVEKASEEYQATKQALEAEVKAREDLELAMAKVQEGAVHRNGDTPSDPEFKAAFNRYLRFRSDIKGDAVEKEFKQILADCEIKPTDDEYRQLKALVVGSNPDGGFLVPVEMQSRIIKRLFETSPMRSIATVINTSTEAVEYVLDDGEYESGWVGEVDDRPETETSKIGIITIPVNEQYAYPKATQKMLDDAAFNVESWISEKVQAKFAREENEAFVIGDGVKRPQGFLDLADWANLAQYERDALETRETAAASTIAADDLIDLQTDLLEPYQANAVWVMARKTWATIMKLKGTNNNYLLDPMFRDGADLQVLGKPIILMGDMQAVADGNIPIAYGDFREGYVIVDRIGIRVLRDPYTSKGFVKFYTTKRVGGKVVNYQAIKRLKVQAA